MESSPQVNEPGWLLRNAIAARALFVCLKSTLFCIKVLHFILNVVLYSRKVIKQAKEIIIMTYTIYEGTKATINAGRLPECC